jgi:hypothetical protein
MNSTRSNAKPRSIIIGCLAAKLLGHSRVATQALTARHASTAFPAFNAQELSNAIGELLDKHLLIQKGNDEKAVYLLTDHGRSGRVTVGKNN